MPVVRLVHSFRHRYFFVALKHDDAEIDLEMTTLWTFFSSRSLLQTAMANFI